ncbi:hypothetical protein QQX98_010802 [Neonectria punicea]|uniref:Xylanolytic transcriptional activator regulatory domain-containing protein n=1 Tax=Neonectria punicea TaxID=979145 RepID=A0ABR1GND5_9HYPO
MSLQDAVRLLLVYQEVVGEFHPLVDLNDLIGRVRAWYTDIDTTSPDQQESPSQSTMLEADEKFLIIHLALAITLRAESTSSTSEIEKTLQHRFQDVLNAKLASPATGIKDVIAVLLAGIYYFFKDMLRSAWRMCGTAGRLLMELGLHNGDVSKHILTSDAQRQEAAIVVCSIIVLDRQWSAATGLPKNFQDSSFDPPPVTLIVTPYLKAMMAFLAISDKFGDSISRAVKGEMDNDNDAYELLNFQLEQWRKKAVGNYSLRELRALLADPALTPPSWAILLNLRAESVRTLVLRPCFFPDSDGETSKKQVHPALDLVENAIHVLFSLEANTDIYRKQHPYYQHLLTSSCALNFLLISYVERKRSILTTLPPGAGSSLSSIYHMALSLVEKYISSSPASRRLWRRLLEMGETLSSLGILSDDGATGNNQLTKNVNVQSESWKANSSRLVQNPGNLRINHRNFTPPSDEYLQPPGHGGLPSNYGTGGTTTTDNSFQLGWAESLLFEWPSGD